MNSDEYTSQDAVGLATAIQRGDYSAAEVTEAAIHGIESVNPTLNAVVMSNFDVARETSREIARKSGKKTSQNGLANGVPFLLKDVNVFSADMPTTFSCGFFEGAKAKPDSEIVRRWRQAGLNLLGKTNTPEFAEDFVCEPTFRGPALNPRNPHVTTGGSSGGAGAAVASGMVPMAHGTDLGGSIRIPAACCGVFGLKPTTGLCPVDQDRSELASGFNSDHVLTRSVRDSAMALDITAKPITGYRYQVNRPVPSYLRCLGEPMERLKIGVCVKTPTGELTPQNQQAAVRIAENALSDLGHEISEYEFPQDLQFDSWMDTLWMFDVVHELQQRIVEVGREPEKDELEAMTRYILARVKGMSAMEHFEARMCAHQTSIQLMTAMSGYDLLLTPALGSDPVPLGYFDSRTDAFNYDEWAKKGYEFAPFSYICNITGQPAASVPVHLQPGKPPCAVQLAGQLNHDHVLLKVCHAPEGVLNWQQYRPPIWVGTNSEKQWRIKDAVVDRDS